MENTLIFVGLSLVWGWGGGVLAAHSRAACFADGIGVSAFALPLLMAGLLLVFFGSLEWPASFGVLVGGIVGAIFGVCHGEWQANKSRPEKRPSDEELEKQWERFQSDNPAPKTTKSKSVYVPTIKGTGWDNYYEKLIDLHGCGPGTAQRIISKVQADQDLTDHERNFWQQVWHSSHQLP